MLAFIRFIKGYYILTLSGYSPERFFNLCRLNGIILWDIIPYDGYYECKIHNKDYFKINPFLEKTKVMAVVQGEYGLPFFMQKNRKRKIFFGGILFSLLFIYGMSFFVWSFSIEGNEKISDDILFRFINSQGVDYGTYKEFIDIQSIEEEIREYFEGISWVSVRLSGTKLIVAIKENYVSEGEGMYGGSSGNDLIAGMDGKIIRIITRKGVPKVKIGEEIETGTVLVEGKVPIYDNDGNIVSYDYVDADADIVIRTEYPIHREISRYYRHKNFTGNEYKIPYVRIGQNYFSLFYNNEPYSLYDVVVKEDTFEVFNEFSLPIYWGVRRYCEYIEIEDLYGEEEGAILLKKFLAQTVEELSEKGVQIIENNVKIETDSQYLRLTGYLVIDVTMQEW